jgi:glucose/mannose transport system permease protein
VVDFEFERANIGQASAAATVMLGSVLAIVAPYLYFELSRKNR